MAIERSTLHEQSINPDLKSYDEHYYQALLPFILGDVLDLGCGEGLFILRYAEKPEVKSVLAIDKFVSDFTHPKVVKKTANIVEGVVVDEKFDCVVSTEFIEHITKQDFLNLLPAIVTSLKPGGIFVGSTPNKIQPTTNPFHLYEYTLEELRDILKQHFSSVTIWDDAHHCSIWKAIK